VATNAELRAVLGLSRPESVPNLTRRFAGRLSADAAVRREYQRLEEGLDGLAAVRAAGEEKL
jgi:hypothetical protein